MDRRAFLASIAGLAGATGVGLLVWKYGWSFNPNPSGGNGFPSGGPKAVQILAAHGMNTFLIIDYGDKDSPAQLCEYLYGSLTVDNLAKTLKTYASQWGIRLWPRVDISEPVPGDMVTFRDALAQVPGGASQTVEQYLWNYNTQFYAVATAGGIPVSPACYLPGDPTDPNANVNNLEYKLVSGAVVPSLASIWQGVVIDSPGLYGSFRQAYDARNSQGGGLSSYSAISGAPLSDHPLNDGSSTGGGNKNTYTRFANSPYFTSQINAQGTHSRDGTPCPIYFLKGQQASFIGNAQIPTVGQMQDIINYHSLGNPFQGVVDGFNAYMVFANAQLELANWQYVNGSSQMFMRTPVTPNVFSGIPSLASAPKEYVAALPDAFSLFMQTGGELGTCYFDWCNPGDDASVSVGPAVGGSPFDNCASAEAVLNWATYVIPNWSHHKYFEMDTMGTKTSQWPAYANIPPILARDAATNWKHYGTILSGMNYPGGWFGYSLPTNVLYLDHYYNVPWNASPMSLLGHIWGYDSYSDLSKLNTVTADWNPVKLSDFKAIYGLPQIGQNPTYAQSLALYKAAIQGGVNAVIPVDLQNGWDPTINDLLGMSWANGSGGANATVDDPNHQFWRPYLASPDINSAFVGLRGNSTSIRTVSNPSNFTSLLSDPLAGPAAGIHRFGNGTVIVLPFNNYGDGFVVNGQGECDGISSGLGLLTINALALLSGSQTPISIPKYIRRTPWARPLSSGQGGKPLVSMTISGSKAGQKLVWLSNNSSSPVSFQMKLSSSFYGFQSPYSLRDINTQVAQSGSGDVNLNVTVPALDWMVFYDR